MEREHIIAWWMLYRRRRRRKQRFYWVHPINMKREEFGAVYTLFPQLRQHEDKFFNYFRMSVSTFDYLYNRLKNTLELQNTRMRECIQPIQMLAVTIRYVK